MKFATKAIHAGVHPDPATGAIMTPIYQTSTYVQSSPGKNMGFEYSRTHNPTRSQLQSAVAALDNGKHGIAFASGMAAIDCVMKLLKPGDEVISTNDLYGGSYRLFTKVYEPFGIKFHFVPMHDMAAVRAVVSEKTKLIWVETPTNPLLNIIDIEAAAAVAKEAGALLAVDNTFSTPYLQTPMDLGADIVMYSLTKYMAGHSDVVMGALVVNDDELHQLLSELLRRHARPARLLPGAARAENAAHPHAAPLRKRPRRGRIPAPAPQSGKSVLARLRQSSQPRRGG
jgi:cystathionine gamma-lyase